jgi:hypothetical protein
MKNVKNVNIYKEIWPEEYWISLLLLSRKFISYSVFEWESDVHVEFVDGEFEVISVVSVVDVEAEDRREGVNEVGYGEDGGNTISGSGGAERGANN